MAAMLSLALVAVGLPDSDDLDEALDHLVSIAIAFVIALPLDGIASGPASASVCAPSRSWRWPAAGSCSCSPTTPRPRPTPDSWLV
jgi:hypothetical protein